MAAYAALLSLMTTLNNIQIHPRVSTFFDNQQIQSLLRIINFLLHFIETSNSHGGSREEEEEVLEMRIASTTHAAEDVIESHVVDQILADAHKKKSEASNLIGRFRRQVMNCARPTTYITDCLLDLETQIKDMNSVKETVMEFRGAIKFKDEQSSRSMSPVSSKPLTTRKKDFMVGFDEKVIQIMDRLTGHRPDLQIVPIVGMGGIGKTTLAKFVYHNLLIVESFDIRAWVTISQEYNVKNALSELLSCVGVDSNSGLETEDHELGLKLYQILSGRRYLIVLDDIWCLEVWDKMKFYFPNNDDRSRVVITTRISSVATHLSSSSFEMNFLDEDQGWKLFCRNVFVERSCPLELEKIGKQIVRECKGLPLSIVVLGGHLRNSTFTCEYWENFAWDLNSILMSGNDEHCLKILSLSYNHLPAHLKPCFLYMGIFQEDVRISVSLLIRLFVAEGFLKPKEGQNMEEIAEDYIHDLVDRNLIMVDSWRWNGRTKYCKMHDLVREVCLKIGERQKIFHMTKMFEIPPVGFHRERRIVFDDDILRNLHKVFEALPSASLVRTFIYDGVPLPFNFRLLRVLTHIKFESLKDICQHVNLRYLNWRLQQGALCYKLPSSVSLLWNLHTLICTEFSVQMEAPSEIWYMRQLRHLQFPIIFLPPPPIEKVEQQDGVLLPNLRTLSKVLNFNFTEKVCKKIPNIKKLGILYTRKCYYYLNHLRHLQSLYCSFGVLEMGNLLQSLVLPSSLRKLSLDICHIHWEDLNKFGLSLPHLEFLKLNWDAGMGDEWDCVEGAFPRLKFLHMKRVDLIKWTAESSELFPVLEQLHLDRLSALERIPSCMGEIQTLASLHVDRCSSSATISSLEILEEQLNLGNDDLQLVVGFGEHEEKRSFMEDAEIKGFTSKNFRTL